MSRWKKFISTLIGKEKKKENKDGVTQTGSCSMNKAQLTYDEIMRRIERNHKISAKPIWVVAPFLEKTAEEIFPQTYFPQEKDFVTTDDK